MEVYFLDRHVVVVSLRLLCLEHSLALPLLKSALFVPVALPIHAIP